MDEHDDTDNIPSNPSGNRPFADVLRVNLERRKFLKSSASLAAGSAVFGSGVLSAFPTTASAQTQNPGDSLIGFTPLSLADGAGPDPAIAPDYQFSVILPWGDPIVPGGPAFKIPVDPDDQTQQIGIGHDGMCYFPILDPDAPRAGWDELSDSNPWLYAKLSEYGEDSYGDFNGVLCLNNEFGGNSHVLRKPSPESLDDVRISQHAHGVTIVQLANQDGNWATVHSSYARRIHVNTPVEFSGPAADHPALHNAAMNEPRGTVNNCANGYTPWGTYLTCEENFQFYFGTEDESYVPSSDQRRYGIRRQGFSYNWHLFDERFDLANPDYAGEINRFGWIVEIDPFNPDAKPIKRTALGRKKNECAAFHVATDGHAVVYIGDDTIFDYVYKYVSAEPWREMMDNGESPLDRGTLYCARFNDDGTGDWLELSMANPVIASAFSDLGQMLVMTRKAADLAGATPMDRPEWLAVAPDGRVYVTCTNNAGRNNEGFQRRSGRAVDTGPNAANPLTPNPDGHIIRWVETYGHSGTKFEWETFLTAQDTHGTEESFSDPDGLYADPDGRLFIETDGGQKDGLQNQLLVADPATREIKRLFTGVPECEITGFAVTPNRKTMFINVQHPGRGNPAVTSFPSPYGSGDIPRDATIVITRKDGGVVGS